MIFGLVEGASKVAQPFFDDLLEQLKINPAGVYQRLMLRNDRRINTDRDREVALAIAQKAVAQLSELPDEKDDFVCDTHQCMASWCGCLDAYRRTHCSCGTTLVSDGVNMVCPCCGWPYSSTTS